MEHEYFSWKLDERLLFTISAKFNKAMYSVDVEKQP